MARTLLTALAAWLALTVAAACGGRTTTTTSRSMASPAPEAGPADLPAMRALLQRFSPSGHYIVSTYEALPRRFDFGDTVTTVSNSQGFDDYFQDGATQNLTDYMSTAVHEVYHAYAFVMAYQLRLDTGAPRGLGAEAVYVGQGPPLLVSYSATVAAREMHATFPADARTARYATYVFPSQDSQSTQVEGVFGLLDEWAAYYHSGRTRLDFWPWLRDEAPANEQLVVTYVARVHEMWVPYAEFKLFILHYLLFARDHHPEVYQGLLANQGFRRAFVSVDDAWTALLAEAGALEPTLHAFARGRGVDADLADGQLTFDGSVFHIRDDAYPAVLRRLASPPYQQILAELRRAP